MEPKNKNQYSEKIDFSTLFNFLKSIRGDVKNACYMLNTCVKCKLKCPSDFLMTIDSDGTPIFVFFEPFQKYSSEKIAPSGFWSDLTFDDFEKIYGAWMRSSGLDKNLCPAKYYQTLKNLELEQEEM